ncbi:hypothetical protein BD769DRAFT_1384246 [Suillus cothurnatus]|nr:hypothetical protein BD769DRAFT_1384246 [Suillus cothurnatus]
MLAWSGCMRSMLVVVRVGWRLQRVVCWGRYWILAEMYAVRGALEVQSQLALIPMRLVIVWWLEWGGLADGGLDCVAAIDDVWCKCLGECVKGELDVANRDLKAALKDILELFQPNGRLITAKNSNTGMAYSHKT